MNCPLRMNPSINVITTCRKPKNKNNFVITVPTIKHTMIQNYLISDMSQSSTSKSSTSKSSDLDSIELSVINEATEITKLIENMVFDGKSGITIVSKYFWSISIHGARGMISILFSSNSMTVTTSCNMPRNMERYFGKKFVENVFVRKVNQPKTLNIMVSDNEFGIKFGMGSPLENIEREIVQEAIRLTKFIEGIDIENMKPIETKHFEAITLSANQNGNVTITFSTNS